MRKMSHLAHADSFASNLIWHDDEVDVSFFFLGKFEICHNHSLVCVCFSCNFHLIQIFIASTIIRARLPAKLWNEKMFRVSFVFTIFHAPCRCGDSNDPSSMFYFLLTRIFNITFSFITCCQSMEFFRKYSCSCSLSQANFFDDSLLACSSFLMTKNTQKIHRIHMWKEEKNETCVRWKFHRKIHNSPDDDAGMLTLSYNILQKYFYVSLSS